MFRASLCPSSGDGLYKTACGVSLDVLAADVWSQDMSCVASTKETTLIGCISDIVRSGHGPGFVVYKGRGTGHVYAVKLQHTSIDSLY